MADLSHDVMYPPLQLFIDGRWIDADSLDTGPVLNPASGAIIGRVPFATRADLDAALDAADRGFKLWRQTPAAARATLLHSAASLMRQRADVTARIISLEQGKPLAEARGEIAVTADVFDWAAEEGMTHEPFGPVVAINSFAKMEDAVTEANRLPYGLAAYAFTGSGQRCDQLADALQAGVLGLNTFAINHPETPFGGVKDSGYGSEGVAAYLISKYAAQASL